jgi:hypothetical protein
LRDLGLILTIGCLCLFSCTTVPDLAPTTASIPIYKIVERVKCELLDAMKGPLHEAADAARHHRRSRYAFLQNWTAGVDLTLIVNDQGGISPGATFTQPLKTESIPLRVTNFARSFNFAVGGGVTTQSFRTEAVSFDLSLKEVSDELDNPRKPGNLQFYHNCVLDSGMDLNSNLGLREWIDSALSPLAPPTSPDYPYLTEGHHPPPAAKAAVGGTIGREALENPTPQDVADVAAKAAALQAEVIALRTKATTDQPSCVAEIIKQASQGDSDAAEAAAAAKIAADKNATPALVSDAYSMALKALAATQNDRNAVVASYNKCVSTVPLDPPMSAISHQVQFIVAWSASATPSWTLLHFKGPGPGAGSNSLLSASQTDTHTLTITLGAPAPGTKGLTGQAQQLRTNQSINAGFNNLGQKITAPAP